MSIFAMKDPDEALSCMEQWLRTSKLTDPCSYSCARACVCVNMRCVFVCERERESVQRCFGRP